MISLRSSSAAEGVQGPLERGGGERGGKDSASLPVLH